MFVSELGASSCGPGGFPASVFSFPGTRRWSVIWASTVMPWIMGTEAHLSAVTPASWQV